MTKKINPWIPVTGVAFGVAALLLAHFGNPGNMGFCIACLRLLAWCWAPCFWRCSQTSSSPRAAAHLPPASCWAPL